MLQRKLCAALVLMLLAAASALAQTAGSREVILVLPFENTSNQREHNWVGESFADALSDLLNVPGLIVVSSDERDLVYQRLRLPLTTLVSRATAIKIGREAKATMVVIGTYNITPVPGQQDVFLQGTARILNVNEGRYEGRYIGGPEPYRRWATSVFDFGGPVSTLQKIQGELAYRILYQHYDKSLPFSQKQIVQQAEKVPQRAFESFIKGAMTDDEEKRTAYLTNAMREYAKANPGQIYQQAAFELGHLYLRRKEWKNAAEFFARIDEKDRHYAEAAFYAGYCYWRTGNLERALGALVPLTARAPLTAIYNNAGAVSLQAAREEKKPQERDRLLQQGLSLLARAADSAPDDPTVRFNYAYALFLSGKFAEAADQLRAVIKIGRGDGEAYFLFAKSLERMGRAAEATTADNEARRYLQTYAKWQTEWQSSQTAKAVSLRLYDTFNRRTYIDKTREEVDKRLPGTDASGPNPQDILAKARALYAEGRDDEALPELRRVLVIEPMSAEAYLLTGRINQRRGDLDNAISALKTAIFWDSRLIDAHILLGRIFLERGDRAMAATYANNAIQIDPNNQEAIALQRQIATGGK
jgi:tetratricopeptide (TPR) repeat protein